MRALGADLLCSVAFCRFDSQVSHDCVMIGME